ncbi:MAG: PocR ligand-binding domain-containing protein [Deltaproteobacteria bacterium]|nr:PocR ligand-binding domain-containing protein [Deltaproteobacteria bacterium]
MTTSTGDNMFTLQPGGSVLSRKPKLADLIDQASFRDLLKSFSELYGIGVKVFDQGGQKLVDFRAQTTEYCGLMFAHYETKVRCTKLVGEVKSCELDSPSPEAKQCFSGLRYRVGPIYLEGDFLGRIVYGPFRPETLLRAPGELQGLAPDMKQQQANDLLVQIRPIAERAIDAVVLHCQKVVDTVIFSGYKALVASQMHIESITAAYSDLEERNRTLSQANDKLREMDRLKSNFIATVSHELRTPLTSVIGYSEMLLEGLAGPLQNEQKDYVATIMEKGESLLQLITSILDLSKIESGTFKLARNPVDISLVAKASLTDVLPQARKKNLNLVSHFPEGGQLFLLDEEKLHRSITNLLGNAVKFTPEGGTVELKVQHFDGSLPKESGKGFDPFVPENNKWLLISVRDTGIGIPDDKLQKVFEPFFQVDSSSTREYGGTGLGLAIVRNFVEAHGGAVWATSELQKGSVFSIAVPFSCAITK